MSALPTAAPVGPYPAADGHVHAMEASPALACAMDPLMNPPADATFALPTRPVEEGSQSSAPASGMPAVVVADVTNADKVLIQIRQRRAAGSKPQAFEVQSASDGSAPAIPMSVSATTVGSWVPREVLCRSSFLARCLNSPEGSAMARALGGDEADDCALEETEDGPDKQNSAVVVRRVAEDVLEVCLPCLGTGHKFLTPSGLTECLDMSGTASQPLDAASVTIAQLLAVFMWAVVLELSQLVDRCREAIVRAVDVSTVALALAVGNASGDVDILRACYWCVRESMCGATGVPSSWLNSMGTVRLVKGFLCYKNICRTPLRILADALSDDVGSKKEKWQTPIDCYTLCQVHRRRGEDGAYPHTYELRLDHSNEVLMTALREDEQSPCRIFKGEAASVDKSEHCEEFLGSVVSNFWGTLFTLYDSGTDVKTLISNVPEAKDLPLRERATLCTIGYETNILGNCPRKVTVEFQRKGVRWHMENVQPRWDKRLNSYALPFFGRVKKASAKNFQLVVDDNINTIYLMFGKITKDVFCLDWRGPISALDAMAIACAALAKKRAVS